LTDPPQFEMPQESKNQTIKAQNTKITQKISMDDLLNKYIDLEDLLKNDHLLQNLIESYGSL
jgi:hypothetical protein